MPVNKEIYLAIRKVLEQKKITLVAVSKMKPAEDILELYNLGQRDFGENYVQEMAEKAAGLPKDIRWHFIGHLQTNKVKLIIPFVQLIHGVDSLKLLKEINKQAEKAGRVIDCLLQIHIAKEKTKFGLNEEELNLIAGELKNPGMQHVHVCGLMGMASFSENMNLVRNEFDLLRRIFVKQGKLQILSMGMSSDYQIAIEEGSNMVRIGSLFFGERVKTS
jgi:pyridoxal phosphate enzyme (YggS family)